MAVFSERCQTLFLVWVVRAEVKTACGRGRNIANFFFIIIIFSSVAILHAQDQLPAQDFVLSTMYSERSVPRSLASLVQSPKVYKEPLKAGGQWHQGLYLYFIEETGMSPLFMHRVPNSGMAAPCASQWRVSSYALPDFPKPVQPGLLKCHPLTLFSEHRLKADPRVSAAGPGKSWDCSCTLSGERRWGKDLKDTEVLGDL